MVYRLLILFDYMGVKKFNITGVDGFNPDFSQNHYFAASHLYYNKVSIFITDIPLSYR
jgi:hypothetical protein